MLATGLRTQPEHRLTEAYEVMNAWPFHTDDYQSGSGLSVSGQWQPLQEIRIYILT